MSMLRTRGMGDWSEPDCEPGTAGCVPHWYCYIPAMATPDCWKSFTEGVSEGSAAVASGAGDVVGAVVGGTASGFGSGLKSGLGSGLGIGGMSGTLITVGLVIGAAVILPKLLGR